MKTHVLQMFIVFAAITKCTDQYAEAKKPEEPRELPTVTSRLRLHSFYSQLPLSKETELFVEYGSFPPVIETLDKGEVIEFDGWGWSNGRQTIRHKLPYLISNPALRTTHVSSEWCKSRDFFKIGFRIHQMYREFGLPYQVKCATCHPIIGGLNSLYYLYPERDFTQAITKLSIGSRVVENNITFCETNDCEQNPRVTNFQDFLRVNDIQFGEWHRWNGEHATTEEDREVLGAPDGELSIHSRIPDGFTTMCGMELNEEVISSNVFVNSDVVTDLSGSKPSFAYSSYESLPVPVEAVKHDAFNLELFVSWNEWGCCSACCCPPAICGHEFQTSSDCENVFSARSRIGHLSIRKLNNSKSITLKTYSKAISELLSLPPYTQKGVPIFSSLFTSFRNLKRPVQEIKDSLFPILLNANNASGYKFSSGMFVDTESCKSNIQKTDCSQWAQCHNISLIGINSEDAQLATDSCNQVQFVDVLVGVEPMKVTVTDHENLRIRIDPEVHNVNKTKARWRVNLRKPKKYDKARPCLLQGIVMRNDEVLILDFASFDLKIDLILNDEKKVRIVFVNLRRRNDAQKVHNTTIYWGIAIAG
ncbi:unnamed protein product [Caenorhabditis sp. 36 PRJEB53466]|nr:unnamed protein product [Caenorhabditis sp. 36 PRJEB53466]